MIQREYDIRLRDSAIFIEGNRPTVRSRKKGNNTMYKVRFFLEGKDLFFVDRVNYKLHPTFPNPFRTVTRSASNQEYELVTWLWGLFAVVAEVIMKDGTSVIVEHKMSFDEELKRRKNEVQHIRE